MVKIGLQLKAFLENVTGLMPDGEDFRCEGLQTIKLFSYETFPRQVVSQAEMCQLWGDSREVAVR